MKKLEERIDEEDKKLMMLKLFVAFLKKIDLMNDSMALSLHLIKYFEEIAL